MQVVADANVLMAALIKRGFALDVLYSENLEVFSPEYVLKEVEDHLGEIERKSGISKEDLFIFLEAVKSRIRVIPSEELKQFIRKAESVSPDPDDIQYFALALKLSCPIWSNEKLLKKQSEIKVFSTAELFEELRK